MSRLLVTALVSTSLPLPSAHAHFGSPALLAPPKVTPADAESHRVGVQERARALASAGDHRGAGLEYDRGAAELGDPVLFLDAAEAYLDAADEEREVELVQSALERARIALDIAYFHRDSASDKNYRIIEASDVSGVISRAEEVVTRSEALVAELEAGTAPPPAPAPAGKAKPGRIKIISGAALTTVGTGLLIMGVAGLGVGAARQRDAEDPTVYAETYDDVERRGKRANVIAGVGLALGAVFAGAGVALILWGRKDAKKAANNDSLVELGPILGSHVGGMTLSGRF